MTPDQDNTIEDTPGELERLELIIDKAAAMRSPRYQSEVRLVGNPDDVAALVLGIARARPNFAAVGKTATGRMGNQTYQYAPLPELVKATAAPLAAENVAVLQFLSGAPEEEHRLTTWVTNGRAYIESVLVFPATPLTDASQVKSWGALTTYLRRYAYQAILQLDGDADADGPAGDLAGKRQPPAIEAAPERPQRRSEPPPKPEQRPGSGGRANAPRASDSLRHDGKAIAPQNGSQAPQQAPRGGFAGRLAENRKAPSEPPSDLPPLWDDQDGFTNLGYVPPKATEEEPVDRPTSPLVEAAKPKDAAGSTVDPKKAEHFLKLAKQLGVTGPKLITWMEKRINKTDPSKVTDKEIDFLIESATEELAAG